MDTPRDSTEQSLNWPAIGALYAALTLGLAGMLYWGDYRNAAWLALIGTGGALTAYGRILANRGEERRSQWWQRAAGVVYGVFVLWAGTVLLLVWWG